MTYIELQKFLFIQQYLILLVLIFLSEWRIKKKHALSCSAALFSLLGLSTISLILGTTNGYDTNVKGFLASMIFFTFYYTTGEINLKKLFYLLIGLLVFEYFLAYVFLDGYHIRRSYLSLDFIRPFSVLGDMHLAAGFVVLVLFVFFRRTGLSFIAAIIFINIQALLTWISMYLSAAILNPSPVKVLKLLIAGCVSILVIWYGTGYLDPNNENFIPMIIDRVARFDLKELNEWCLLFGCATNWQNADEIAGVRLDGLAVLDDIGYLNILYQFGLIWCIIFIYKIYQLNPLVAVAVAVSSFHYAVFFGLLGIALTIIVARNSAKVLVFHRFKPK